MNDSIPAEPEIWYRYRDIFDSAHGARVLLEKLSVVRHTPCGVWLRPTNWWGGRDRFVLASANKRFACPTIEEARASFIARKKRQIVILTHQLRQAKDALVAVDTAVPEPEYYLEPF